MSLADSGGETPQATDHAGQDITAKSITLSQSSGADAIVVSTNGARVHFGAGASDYASSDGTTVTFATHIASAATVTGTGYGVTSSVSLGQSLTNGVRWMAFIADASGKAALDVDTSATWSSGDLIDARNNGVQKFKVGPTGTVAATMGTGVGTAVMVGTATVDTTAVGNVGAGTDTLITYSLPASSLTTTGRGVRITAWGTTANTANAKTVTLDFGSQTIMTQALTTGLAGTWRITATAFRTGSNTQDIFAELLQLSTIIHKHTLTAGTQTETSAIVIKCTGTATDNDEIVQEGLLVEYL